MHPGRRWRCRGWSSGGGARLRSWSNTTLSKLPRAIFAQFALMAGLVALGLVMGLGWWPGVAGGVIGLIGVWRKR